MTQASSERNLHRLKEKQIRKLGLTEERDKLARLLAQASMVGGGKGPMPVVPALAGVAKLVASRETAGSLHLKVDASLPPGLVLLVDKDDKILAAFTNVGEPPSAPAPDAEAQPAAPGDAPGSAPAPAPVAEIPHAIDCDLGEDCTCGAEAAK